jgi:hypothetical protein
MQSRAGRGDWISRFTSRWRWYHFYFLLALLDLAVILASVALYHSTLASYREALQDLTAVLEKQRWVADLRVGLVELNAPGNDIFETRSIDREQARFTGVRDHLKDLVALRSRFFQGQELSAFERNLEAMIAAEQRVFDAFETMAAGLPAERERALLDEASVAMATMDRFQAVALGDLVTIERELRSREADLLSSYGAGLERRARFEG